ncbi:hypothetical protein Tco_1061515 [Tanacetum coccineum]
MFHTEEELASHKELLDVPHPPFSTLELKIRRGDPWSLKTPCVIGTVYMGHVYIDLQSPVNIMSRAYYNKIRTKYFQARRIPYQPHKICNFVGRDKSLHVFVGFFVYVMDFMILDDLGSVIDSRLSEVVLGKPFVEASKLTYDHSLGLIRFAHRNDEVIFRMPQRTQELHLISPLEKDKFEAFFLESLKVRKRGFKQVLEKRKGYYKASVMSSASSAVTYTSVYTDSEPGRAFWGADEEISDGGSLRVIVYGYDRLPMQPVALPSPDYIPDPEEP